MINGLEHIGNIPISTSALSSLYPEMKAGNQKVRNLELAGKLIRLKKGLYVVNPNRIARSTIHRANCQSHLCDAKLR
ncbi:hypothetical protein [Prevotella conceptionensis]|uniref:hypothetical protein n=1 Tax=Prevotella conceptionensis TaxID=340486 RepID=UPI0002FEFD6A|nr:hypothetical protein [Prevotella conceptionensis]